MHLKILLVSAATAIILSACGNNIDKPAETKPAVDSPSTNTAVADNTKKSIPSEATANISGTRIHIAYTAPTVRDRVIWGGLVPYNQVWVTGAHKATTLEIDKSFSVGDKNIPAGKYAIFSIPGKEEWTVIINKNWDQHLADDYSEKEDLVRLKVKPEMVDHTERLKYTIEAKGNSDAVISVNWEKLKISFPVKIGS